jgi:hypothetical protein
MNEIKEVFIDGVGKIGLYGGAVRCELISVIPDADGKAAKTNNTINIVMAPQGFLQVVNTLEGFVRQLEDKGVFVKKDEQ